MGLLRVLCIPGGGVLDPGLEGPKMEAATDCRIASLAAIRNQEGAVRRDPTKTSPLLR